MDALALLAEEDDDEEEEDDEEENEAGNDENIGSGHDASTPAKLDFNSLQKAGYSGNVALSETDMYQRAGANPPPHTQPQSDSNRTVIEAAPMLIANDNVSAEPPVSSSSVKETENTKEILTKAAMRDRKRAGVNGYESTRQKNARKMKMGQANFSLKDDRDCVNPFIDSSHDPHVKGFGGKRVDKRASVKQISNLDFTS